MSKTLWEMSDEEAEAMTYRSKQNIKDLVIIAVVLAIIWGATVISAL